MASTILFHILLPSKDLQLRQHTLTKSLQRLLVYLKTEML